MGGCDIGHLEGNLGVRAGRFYTGKWLGCLIRKGRGAAFVRIGIPLKEVQTGCRAIGMF